MRLIKLFLVSFLFFLACEAVWAGSILLSPLGVEIPPNEWVGSLTITNTDTKTALLQIRVLSWSQSAFEDQLSQQNQVIVTPPFVTLPAGAKQLVRMNAIDGKAASQEQAYRVIIDEIPVLANAASPEKDVSGRTLQASLRFQMRYSLPLFRRGSAEKKVFDGLSEDEQVAARLRWWLSRSGETNFLYVKNDGMRHARLSSVQWASAVFPPSSQADAGDSEPLEKIVEAAPPAVSVFAEGLMGYVLPGQVMRWAIPNGFVPSPEGRLQARLSDSGALVQLPYRENSR